MKKILLLALFAAFAAHADTLPVPKVFKGMQGQKGQYQVDILEAPSGKSSMNRMTICTDNLMNQNQQAQGKSGRPSSSSCKQKLLKDTADEAVIENVCDNRTSKVTIKRESAKSMLMTVENSGAKGPQTMKMRYTHLGACREGQGTVGLDPNSEQCQKIKAQAAKMKDREMAERLSAMCK